MLYGSSKIMLRNLTDTEKQHLETLATMSRSLYNLCTVKICDLYENTGKVLGYHELKQLVVDSKEYTSMTGWFYQTLISAIHDFKIYISTSNYTLSRSDRTLRMKNLDNFIPPHPKDIIRKIDIGHPHVADGFLVVPCSRYTPQINLKLPKCYLNKNIIIATIRPLYHNRYWELIIEYTVTETPHCDLSKDRVMGLDLGITNFATCSAFFLDENRIDSFIVDGKRLKSIVQGYCKSRAKLQSLNPCQTNTKRLCSLSCKTHNKINDYVAKSASTIIKYCIDNRISKLCFGWSENFQMTNGLNLGINNQSFALFPFAKLKAALKYQCDKHGIDFVVVNESYTSQASFIDKDAIPDFVSRKHHYFSGARIHRGIYMSADGVEINADVNGACNIIVKHYQSRGETAKLDCLDRRGLAYPKRIKIF